VIGLVVLGALLLGGIIGAAVNRRWPSRSGPPTKRSIDSDDVDVQAGFRNIVGGP
jgi:hypothetical protein